MKAPYNLDQLIRDLVEIRKHSPRTGMTYVYLGEFPVHDVRLDGNVCRMTYSEKQCKHCHQYDCDPEYDSGCDQAMEEWD